MDMNRLTTLDINKLTPYAVGFDRVFDDMFKYVNHNQNSTGGYPPYNIVRDGEKFQIEIALAGIAKEDLDITVAEGVLTVEHTPEGEVESSGWEWLHKGISQRHFKRNFTLSDDIVVNGSRMENGMLFIELERIVPDEKKPRTIQIK
jgi:molecular chaperone IbpA